ncbi:hypothetical protein CYMTET_7902 [Cymbomonas tetramitiformis]|uniref:Sulfhydryl oxidase n=1 Tax=Cymbomonas tetramitiformis TaxID=36881 RepID=A0AAE0GUJ8_9CHLO|nr:hypothetical protein CYMTET_7902 [Cymbomonas tetramitiformis]
MSIDEDAASRGISARCPTDSWKRGISADEWGPDGWCLLHFVAMAMPPALDATSRFRFVSYVRTLAFVLPCYACRRHCHAYFESLEQCALRTRWDCVTLIGDFHNAVNVRLGKPVVHPDIRSRTISVECAISSYRRFRESVRRACPVFTTDEELECFRGHFRMLRELLTESDRPGSSNFSR